MNNKIYTKLTLAILVIVFSASGCFDDKKNHYVGSYDVRDKANNTFHISLNNDKTATITGVGVENDMCYCSWIYDDCKNAVYISFSDIKPVIVFEGGLDDYPHGLYLCDGWLYKGSGNSLDSKNPKWRLKATKVK